MAPLLVGLKEELLAVMLVATKAVHLEELLESGLADWKERWLVVPLELLWVDSMALLLVVW